MLDDRNAIIAEIAFLRRGRRREMKREAEDSLRIQVLAGRFVECRPQSQLHLLVRLVYIGL